MSDKQKKRYYWLKLKENFFEEDTIAWLEEQPNGKEYCLIYLKLCLKSLKTDGMLVRNVGNMIIPYDAETLARITSSTIDTIKVAMDLFRKIGLIQIFNDGEIYLNQLNELVGSETEAAKQKRLQRAKVDNVQTKSIQSPKNVAQSKSIEKEKDIELEKDIETEINNNSPTQPNIYINNNSLFQAIEKNFGRQLSPIELETIADWKQQSHYPDDLVLVALREAVLNQAYSLKYMDRILLDWERKGIKTKEQAIQTLKKWRDSKTQKQEIPTNADGKPQITLHNWLNPEEDEKG
ncbi:phage replisome organizer N-terminal domain-containing protein [Melissococcus plutonius]|uniref:DnaD domain protein n=1 Tax=Melissococcus plutonius TaxID=33970 RepID=UPI0021E5A64A|nr:DnaD domain protein [Melissococcus plutonius]MCV2505670.1 phage replisome organizer N-terminal domain-containing protein [Melissococcus plutonius]